MSHAIYQTKAIILKTKNMRESNKLLVLYTERFGVIYAAMQSVRELKSKMKYHSNTLSLVTVDLVRGRDIWRITGIHEQYSSLVFAVQESYPLLHRFAVLLLRLCRGEDAHQQVWDDILALYTYTQENETLNTETFAALEIIFVARLLYFLGYWDSEESFIITENPCDTELFSIVLNNKKKYIQRINQGIVDSQL